MSVESQPKTRAGRRGRKAPAETRDQIIALTRDRMSAEGLSAIKARPIAAMAGVSVGSLYNMFGDLNDLVRLANGLTYNDLFAHQTAALTRARDAEYSPTERLYTLAHAYLDWVGDHHKLWSATLSFNREQLEDAPGWYREKEIALLGIIEAALEDFPVSFEGRTRLHTARALWASIHGIVTMAMGPSRLLLPKEEIDLQMWIVIRAVAGALESQ